jgi:signal transduction histidine kinase
MGEMISAIAHQWRQPLNTLSLYNITLESKEYLSKEDIQEFREKSNNVIQQMSQTINDFRDFFKPNKNKEKFFISKSLQKVLGMIEVELKEKNIIIKNSIDSELSLFNFKSEFEQVLINLINNAKDAILKISNPKMIGIIELKSIKNDKEIILEISDNGGGIDLNIIDKIFEPYFTTKFESQGTGLGLYMSKMIIERNMGGQIIVANNDNGTTFKVIFGLDK